MTNQRRRTRNRSGDRGRFSRFLVVVVLLGVGCLLFWRLWLPSSPLLLSGPKATPPKIDLKLAALAPDVDFSTPECLTFYGQNGEDRYLFIQYFAVPEVKRNGVFVEIGAFDGVEMSNSYWYEMCLGWTGVLIEGHPVSAKNLRRNRPNTKNFEAAACEKDEGNVTFVGKASVVAGDATQMPDDFLRAHHKGYLEGTEETNIVQCRRISSMLEEAGVDHIDFWTLDVEGAEFSVLTSFDWEKVAVHVLLVETDKNESKEFKRRHDLLTSKGMTFVGPITIKEIWVNFQYPAPSSSLPKLIASHSYRRSDD